MANMKTLLMFLLVMASLLTACEGYRTAAGVVKDKGSNRPIRGVVCTLLSGQTFMITDSTGRYSLQNPMGGCMPHCKDIIIRFDKSGYKIVEYTNPTDSIIFLEKQ
jgi:hypothetical protein